MGDIATILRSRRCAFIDFEASGLGHESYPVSVGVAFLDDASKTFEAVLRPLPHWTHWSRQAEQMHKLSPAYLREFGRPPAQVALELTSVLRGYALFSDNPWHDEFWFERMFRDALGIGLSRDLKVHSLQALAAQAAAAAQVDLNACIERARSAFPHTHVALDDARGMRAIMAEVLRPESELAPIRHPEH